MTQFHVFYQLQLKIKNVHQDKKVINFLLLKQNQIQQLRSKGIKVKMKFIQTKNENSYTPFNFLKLDNKLNVKKIEQRKREQHEKNVLNLYLKKLPNVQMIQQCNNIMGSYKDHYNINRMFSVFYDETKYKKIENEEEREIKVQIKQLHLVNLGRSQSTSSILTSRTEISSKKRSILQADRIMRPIKSNQYLSEKGIVKLQQKSSQLQNQIKISKRSSINKNIDSQLLATIKLSSSTGLGMRQFSRSETTKKFRNQNDKSVPQKVQSLTKNNSFRANQKKKYLKLLFRKNIYIILHKLRLMKLPLNDIIEQNIFDKSLPYKFGNQIFHAIKQGNEPKVFRILMQKRLSIFSVDTTGKTTLMWACIRGYQQIAQLLLSNGVDPHAKDMNGRSALELAIKYDSISCVKTLFIYSYHVEVGIQKIKMSSQMRKMVQIGISLHKFLKDFNNIEKKKEQFEHQYKYYFKN